jgi:transposase
MLLSEGQMSDYKGAAFMLDALPKAKAMLGDKGYDADWFRSAPDPERHRPLYPFKGQPQGPDPSRQGALSAAAQDREHVWKAEGLAAHPHPLRPMRPHLHVRNRHRRRRHLLAMNNES